MSLSLIVASSTNDVIGANGELPWHLPDDLRYFKKTTLGKPVIMGRITYESIGRPLPGRLNLVVSRSVTTGSQAVDSNDFSKPYWCESLDQAIAIAAEQSSSEVFVIGGAQLYEAALRFASRIYLTRVHGNVEGDAFFSLPKTGWQQVAQTYHEADDRHAYPFDFLIFERILNPIADE